ncbi:NAD(P)/FAD-dependent oxidoreductase [Spirulina subsalsa FACHB-351]|uniref:NAD(P)/FAD-dependent oxidoreductase n=1 Tax=Spirulina subsalsa FACHB-351 TaxID=234711 RepID=A0ABT3L513_9CYAN|nr:NAD(P)/FAD-dependent oxidoreductase [Spirulina subsalsa]MCW6036584.1 NAD(P)/FAD-dependent oxidoreductase [Spirulina subsalsa FACHB-351]
MTTASQRIVILGGGFGGLYTALRLSQFPWQGNQPEIVLVDKNDRFLFSPLLYELITGELQSWEIAPPFEELLSQTGIRFYQAKVTGIQVEEQYVELENRPALAYDYLAIALGGQTPLNNIPGVQDYAIPFRTLPHAYHLLEKLRILEQSDLDKIRIAIIGGGYSGVELACKLADRLGERGRIRIVERGEKLLKTATDFNRQAAEKALEERKVWVDLETSVESVGADSLELLYKGQIDLLPVEIVLWTVGTQVCDLIRHLPLPHNERGQLMTQPTLQVVDYPHLFALGDAALCQDVTGQELQATAQVAIQQADYCAWNLWASLCDRPLLPFRYQSLGEMLALGVETATLNGLGIKLDGSLGYVARRLAYLYRLPTLQHQLAVGVNWLTQPLLNVLSQSKNS